MLVTASAILAVPAHSQQKAGVLIEFDAPGAATTVAPQCGSGCGTQPLANNDSGTVIGYYTDDLVVPHGFIRTRDGHFTSFDAPGAGLGAGLDQGTVPISINDRGVIAGQYEDSNNVFHGFIRYPDGSFVSFEAPGAATAVTSQCAPIGCGTLAYSINEDGETAGIYVDSAGAQHGFVRSRWGDITTFDPPGSAGTMVCEETCINREGTVTGGFIDATQTFHGFLRHRDGTLVTFDAPDAGVGGGAGGGGASITDRGEIAGYILAKDGTYYGTIRHRDGNFSPNYQFPAAGPGTVFYSINVCGVTAGDYLDQNFAFHGLSRWPSGEVKTFDAPDAGGGALQGTRSSTNNVEGEVTGWYVDATGLNHGFVWRP
jgi:hypothetical protein